MVIGICGRHVEQPIHDDAIIKRTLPYGNIMEAFGITYFRQENESNNKLITYYDTDYVDDLKWQPSLFSITTDQYPGYQKDSFL